jgi:hypothetical protein
MTLLRERKGVETRALRRMRASKGKVVAPLLKKKKKKAEVGLTGGAGHGGSGKAHKASTSFNKDLAETCTESGEIMNSPIF